MKKVIGDFSAHAKAFRYDKVMAEMNYAHEVGLKY
jgi:hypothetical protein